MNIKPSKKLENFKPIPFQTSKGLIHDSSIFIKFLNHRIVNFLMSNGKKNAAISVLKETYALLRKQNPGKNVFEIVLNAVKNATPLIGCKAERRGRNLVHTPQPISHEKALNLSLRWIVAGAKARKRGRSLSTGLAEELTLASKGENCFSIEQKEKMHKNALEGKRFETQRLVRPLNIWRLHL